MDSRPEWFDSATGDDQKVFLANDKKTYVLEPCARFWKELVNQTVLLTGAHFEYEFHEGRTYKYVVREEDVEKCAHDLRL